MFKSLCAALGASLLLAYAPGAALAADLNRPPTSADAPSEQWRPSIWQGMYVGLSAGYGWGDSEHFYDRNDNHGTASQSLEGGLGSVTLGYNHLVSPNFLIGVEGDLGFMDLGADDKVDLRRARLEVAIRRLVGDGACAGRFSVGGSCPRLRHGRTCVHAG